ncbi:tRNA (guanosine(46)-N7)-methyltransferase TrmB [Ponticaulis sp.]|uniref:tRNA (guanosine(46)-N7)-methyltransferase TrmB n=1 Tax=Ponticaulis sp. TaxID=2020902 RepID=UPI000B75E8C2|nr:tRNA (guanosine(46)-N7)-methyltransferase TrmB [Ponticaulis sp.]MAI91060.1 tRNA (guanosine(46)-N7)-methyltransferase TrmB [Ponticaulis sp.]OUX98391.1 MAG: tRNA (guanosine(46)-N7)-methyltransferase TrmB [Hyphomonadaceae bacterium TMED5]|tara:strand:+ start:80939 stop:81625 length:687 start_codon:yes stop_codon:yes gene_type:complete
MSQTDRPLREIKSFGRRDGRPLSKKQKHLYDTLLPDLALPTDEPLSATSLFGDERPLWLEIGFGGSEHLIRRARLNPDIGLIGAEPFIDGVAKALTGISDNNLKNVRLHADDIRQVLPNFGEAAFERVFILFPDPWPKRRQQKRRLIQPAFLDELARAMKPGAALRFATDVKSYANEALWRFLQHGAFEWTAENAADWRDQPEDHEPTRYQLKKLGDCEPVWLEFIRT